MIRGDNFVCIRTRRGNPDQFLFISEKVTVFFSCRSPRAPTHGFRTGYSPNLVVLTYDVICSIYKRWATVFFFSHIQLLSHFERRLDVFINDMLLMPTVAQQIACLPQAMRGI
jgi:hypothetical protein